MLGGDGTPALVSPKISCTCHLCGEDVTVSRQPARGTAAAVLGRTCVVCRSVAHDECARRALLFSDVSRSYCTPRCYFNLSIAANQNFSAQHSAELELRCAHEYDAARRHNKSHGGCDVNLLLRIRQRAWEDYFVVQHVYGQDVAFVGLFPPTWTTEDAALLAHALSPKGQAESLCMLDPHTHPIGSVVCILDPSLPNYELTKCQGRRVFSQPWGAHMAQQLQRWRLVERAVVIEDGGTLA